MRHISVLAPAYSLGRGIGVVHPRSVTEIALIKSTVLTCEKKLYPYDFRGSAKVIRYSV